MPDQGTPQFTLTRTDSEDAATAYLAAVNPLQTAIDGLTWHHGLLIGLAEKDRDAGGPGRVDPQLVIDLRERARQLVLHAERTAEAVWELAGDPSDSEPCANCGGEGVVYNDHDSTDERPYTCGCGGRKTNRTTPPRGPQMDAARAKLAAEPEPASHQDRQYDQGMGATNQAPELLEIRKAEVLDAMRWIKSGMPQEVDGPSMFDLHAPAAIRGSQLGWVRVMPAGTFELTRKGHAILAHAQARALDQATGQGRR